MASTKTLKFLVTKDSTQVPGADVIDFVLLASGVNTEIVRFEYNESMITAAELAAYCDIEYDARKLLNPELRSTYGAYLNAFLDNGKVVFNLPAEQIPSIGKYTVAIEDKIVDYYTLV